jgi:predicted DNA-binding transcriptional regulator AlpA
VTTAAEDRVREAVDLLAEALIALAHEQATEAARPAPVELLDVRTAAQRLGGMSRSTLYQCMTAGTVQSVTVGGRRLIPSTEIERLATSDRPRRGRAA